MAATTRPPTTMARMSLPLLSATNFWISTFCLLTCSMSTMASARFSVSARTTPMPCVPSISLTIDRRPAHARDGVQHVAPGRARRRRAGMPMSWRLRICSAAQLVARHGDAGGACSREDAHLLELAHHGGAEEGDRGTDARDHRIVAGKRPAPVEEPRQLGLDEDREAQGVETRTVSPRRHGGLAQAAGAVGALGAGENGDVHASSTAGAGGESGASAGGEPRWRGGGQGRRRGRRRGQGDPGASASACACGA